MKFNSNVFRVVSIMSAFNEGDIISQSIEHLISQGIEVYLMDNCSTDNTVSEARKWLGKGLIHIENFPEDSGYPVEHKKEFVLQGILKRKEELAQEIKANWFINSDVDEFQFSPWVDLNLKEAIQYIEWLGFNLINHRRLNFESVEEDYTPGSDVFSHFNYFQPDNDWNLYPLIRIWKNQPARVNLHGSGGHLTEFPGAVTAPVRFLMLHYCIRSLQHGQRKIFEERLNRFSTYEKDELNMHPHYNKYLNGDDIIKNKDNLTKFDLNKERARLLSEFSKFFILYHKIKTSDPDNYHINQKDFTNYTHRDISEGEFTTLFDRYLYIIGYKSDDSFEEGEIDKMLIPDYLAISEILLIKLYLKQDTTQYKHILKFYNKLCGILDQKGQKPQSIFSDYFLKPNT